MIATSLEVSKNVEYENKIKLFLLLFHYWTKKTEFPATEKLQSMPRTGKIKRNKKRVACFTCTLHLKIVTYLSFTAQNNKMIRVNNAWLLKIINLVFVHFTLLCYRLSHSGLNRSITCLVKYRPNSKVRGVSH